MSLLGEVHDDFLDMQRAKFGPDSRTYKDCVDRLKPFCEKYGNLPFASITDIDGLNYRRYLMNEKLWKKGKVVVKGMKPPSVNSRLRAAKSMFKSPVFSPAASRHGLGGRDGVAGIRPGAAGPLPGREGLVR